MLSTSILRAFPVRRILLGGIALLMVFALTGIGFTKRAWRVPRTLSLLAPRRERCSLVGTSRLMLDRSRGRASLWALADGVGALARLTLPPFSCS